MEWLVQVLTALRGVRDAASHRDQKAPRPVAPLERAEASVEDPSLSIPPMGPATPPRRRRRRSRAERPVDAPSGSGPEIDRSDETEAPAPSERRRRSPRGARAPRPEVVEPAAAAEVPPTEVETEADAPSEDDTDSGPRLSVRAFDRDAVEVVRRLRKHGYTAYVVGGCVRDVLVGLPPKDFDVSTSARPEEIRKVFRNSRIIGRRFRLVHIYFRGGKIIETATFRGSATEDDEGGEDLLITRDNVWGSEEEDARRRDFTINALMYDVDGRRVIDHVDGLADIEARVIRTIGDPDIRMQEDPVRILRAARFAAKLGFELEPGLRRAMATHRGEILRCPQARVLEETYKLMRSGHAEASLHVLNDTGVLEVILPEIARYLDSLEEPPAVSISDYLYGLDRVVAERGPVSDPVVLAALLLAPLDQALLEVEPSKRAQKQWSIVEQIAERLGATRKVRERLRQLFGAQRYLSGGGARRGGRRRAAPASMLRRSYFPEAIDLFEVWALANQQELASVEHWRERLAEAAEYGDVEPGDDEDGDAREASEEPSTGRRRGRRRRRRRGGGRGEGDGGRSDGD